MGSGSVGIGQYASPPGAQGGGKVGTVERRRMLGQIAIVGFALFAIAVLMLIVGDPIWNLYFIGFGFFIALPAAVVALIWRQVRR